MRTYLIRTPLPPSPTLLLRFAFSLFLLLSHRSPLSFSSFCPYNFQNQQLFPTHLPPPPLETTRGQRVQPDRATRPRAQALVSLQRLFAWPCIRLQRRCASMQPPRAGPILTYASPRSFNLWLGCLHLVLAVTAGSASAGSRGFYAMRGESSSHSTPPARTRTNAQQQQGRSSESGGRDRRGAC